MIKKILKKLAFAKYCSYDLYPVFNATKDTFTTMSGVEFFKILESNDISVHKKQIKISTLLNGICTIDVISFSVAGYDLGFCQILDEIQTESGKDILSIDGPFDHYSDMDFVKCTDFRAVPELIFYIILDSLLDSIKCVAIPKKYLHSSSFYFKDYEFLNFYHVEHEFSKYCFVFFTHSMSMI